MSGLPTNGAPFVDYVTGNEQLPIDTNLPNGQFPQYGTLPLQQLAAASLFLMAPLDKTPAAGTRYYGVWFLQAGTTLTGLQALIGATGGTDKWLVELHSAAGVLLATSNTSGVTVSSTAKTWQQFPFQAPAGTNTPYTVPATGLYFLTLQSNGTTAVFQSYNAPMSSASNFLSGSTAGTFGTGANFTAPTTYTANLAPIMMPYV